MRVQLPHLIETGEVCERLHISTTALRRWEANGFIPFITLGPARRYRAEAVEKELRKHRFGPSLAPDVKKDELRERVSGEEICAWLKISRTTLDQRMGDGLIPYYKFGQTYRFAPDEVAYSLGIELDAPEPEIGFDLPGGLS